MPLYAAKASSSSVSDLYTINYSTAVATSIGPMGHAMTGLAFDPTSNILYGASSPNNGVVAKRRGLFTINPTTGAATFIAQFDGDDGIRAMADIAFDSTGQLYGWSGESHHLHRINKADASYVDLGLGVFVVPAAITFDPDDVLYMIGRFGGQLRLYTVNKTTGDTTLIGPFSPTTNLLPGAASFGSDGLIWWLDVNFSGLNTVTTDGAWATVGDRTTDPGDYFDALAWSVGGGPPPKTFTKIKFGTGLSVTDEGAGVIRVDVV